MVRQAGARADRGRQVGDLCWVSKLVPDSGQPAISRLAMRHHLLAHCGIAESVDTVEPKKRRCGESAFSWAFLGISRLLETVSQFAGRVQPGRRSSLISTGRRACRHSPNKGQRPRGARLPENGMEWKEWCPPPDSNRHVLRRRILSPLRLPFRQRGTAEVSSAGRGFLQAITQPERDVRNKPSIHPPPWRRRDCGRRKTPAPSRLRR